MKLVLVAGFNTSKAAKGPIVTLAAGKWKIGVEGHKDCLMALGVDDPNFQGGQITNGFEFTLSKDTNICFDLRAPGTEEFINVYAEMVK